MLSPNIALLLSQDAAINRISPDLHMDRHTLIARFRDVQNATQGVFAAMQVVNQLEPVDRLEDATVEPREDIIVRFPLSSQFLYGA